jgi:hypothetical protein
MRSKLTLAIALCLALAVPTTALGAAAPWAVLHQDGAIATYTYGDKCVIVSVGTGDQINVGDPGLRPNGGLDVAIWNYDTLNRYCATNLVHGQPVAQIVVVIPLEAAYAIGSVALTDPASNTVYDVSVDLAWVASGVPVQYKDQGPGWSVVAKDAPAHLTGSVFVNGAEWTTDRTSGTLRTIWVSKNY